MSIKNTQTLRLKKTVVNGRNQTVYHAKVYRPYELPQLLVDENIDFIEVVNDGETAPNRNSIFIPEKGIEVKTIQNVVVEPETPLPSAQEIRVEKAVEKVITKRVRKPQPNNED